jgi:hypothetical protein
MSAVELKTYAFTHSISSQNKYEGDNVGESRSREHEKRAREERRRAKSDQKNAERGRGESERE